MTGVVFFAVRALLALISAVLVRQILDAMAQFDKAMTVAKLRSARERKRRPDAKVEGRRSLAESHPEARATAIQLREQHPRMSLRDISTTLAEVGIVAQLGKGKKPRGGHHFLRHAIVFYVFKICASLREAGALCRCR